MIREEIIENLWGEAVRRDFNIGKSDITEIVDYVIKHNEPQLPAGLDEAAVEFSKDVASGHIYKDLCAGFKAGAEWMTGQGIVGDAEVCKLTNRAWVTILDEKQFQNVLYDKFNAGDKVIVQIRKK